MEWEWLLRWHSAGFRADTVRDPLGRPGRWLQQLFEHEVPEAVACWPHASSIALTVCPGDRRPAGGPSGSAAAHLSSGSGPPPRSQGRAPWLRPDIRRAQPRRRGQLQEEGRRPQALRRWPRRLTALVSAERQRRARCHGKGLSQGYRFTRPSRRINTSELTADSASRRVADKESAPTG